MKKLLIWETLKLLLIFPTIGDIATWTGLRFIIPVERNLNTPFFIDICWRIKNWRYSHWKHQWIIKMTNLNHSAEGIPHPPAANFVNTFSIVEQPQVRIQCSLKSTATNHTLCFSYKLRFHGTSEHRMYLIVLVNRQAWLAFVLSFIHRNNRPRWSLLKW